MNTEDVIALINGSTQHNCLYHFTDCANLKTIKERGLLSKRRMKKLGFWPHKPSGNELSWRLDERKGVDEFVSLCLTQNHPMSHVAEREGRIENVRYLRISPTVLHCPGVKFSFGVANKAGLPLVDLVNAIDKIDYEVLYTRTDWKDARVRERLRKAEKFEVLIPGGVERSLIEGL